MRLIKKILLIFAVMTVFVICTLISASAISKTQQSLVDYTDKSLLVESSSVSYDSLMRANIKTAKSIEKTFGAGTERTKALALSDDEISKISDRIAKNAKIYKTVLEDGRKTYYISVDMRTEDSLYLRNPLVLRQTAEKLVKRTEKLKGKSKDTVLMDYTHIVGELKLHLIGYNATKNLGVENSKGLIGKVYRSCSVSDLNIDEDRFPVMIRRYGIIVG